MNLECNVCKGKEFVDMNGRPKVRCKTCGSLERTRVMKLFLDKSGLPGSGSQVLHLAPEKGLMALFSGDPSITYTACDLDPGQYPPGSVRQMDLVAEAEKLPSEFYDVVIHSHVMEHVPCNVTAVLFHLHRSLKPGGMHIFSVPILSGTYDCFFGDLSAEERVRRFGQDDHVRRFGQVDFQKTIGMIFNIPQRYELASWFSEAELDRCNIPDYARAGFTSSSVFSLKKEDLKLVCR